jgi:hypothetical protein
MGCVLVRTEGHLGPGAYVVRGSVHLVREANGAPRELIADRGVMSCRSAKRAHPRIPKDSREIREFDALGRVAEQDRAAVEEEAHGAGLSKGRASVPMRRPYADRGRRSGFSSTGAGL